MTAAEHAVPIKPTLSWRSFGPHRRTPVRSVLDAGNRLEVTSGRIAIAIALQNLGVQPGDEVLVPAYHCGAMVEPIVALGATPVFYRISPATTVDLDHISARLSSATKALIVTHYFGFPQPMQSVLAFATEHKLGLIEDCAHMFFGSVAELAPGAHGDYAIASAMKFFPVYDGGYLISRKHPIDDSKVRSAGVLFDIKSLFASIEYGASHKRLWPVSSILRLAFAAKDRLWTTFKRAYPAVSEQPLGPSSSDGGASFDSRWIDIGMSRPSRLLIKLADTSRIVDARRSNFLLMLRLLEKAPRLTPVFRELPPNVVPHVFPILLDDPRSIPELRAAGVPLLHFGEQLWPNMDEGICPVSVDYSRRLVQLPCHQDLSAQDITRIADRAVEALSSLRQS